MQSPTNLNDIEMASHTELTEVIEKEFHLYVGLLCLGLVIES